MSVTEYISLGYKERNLGIGHGKMRVQPGRAMVQPRLLIWLFFFHLKKNPKHHRFVTEENIQVGKEGKKGGTEGGRKGEGESKRRGQREEGRKE